MLLDAPLTGSLAADLPSLKPLQPWLGTLAVVDGRAHIGLTAGGSLAKVVLSGTLTADAVRVDLRPRLEVLDCRRDVVTLFPRLYAGSVHDR